MVHIVWEHKVVKYEIILPPQDLNPVWRETDNPDYKCNNPLKYFSIASKSKGCNFSLSVTDSSAAAKFSNLNANHSKSVTAFKVSYRSLQFPCTGKVFSWRTQQLLIFFHKL